MPPISPGSERSLGYTSGAVGVLPHQLESIADDSAV
jgi:hypothetical protein